MRSRKGEDLRNTPWSGYYRNKYQNKIREVLPLDGSKVRAQTIYTELRKQPKNGKIRVPSTSTIQKYLESLEAEGVIKRIQKSHKEVYYRWCENVRLLNLIEGFIKEIDISLSELPETLKENLAEKDLNALMNDETRLKSCVIAALIRKVHDLLRMVFSNPLSYTDFYVGVIGKTVKIVPKQPNYDWNKMWES